VRRDADILTRVTDRHMRTSRTAHVRVCRGLVSVIIIIINEYYYSGMESKKLQEHLTKKIKPTRCRLAYGPADATATHCLLLQ